MPPIDFRPQVNERIFINEPYLFTAHPAAPDFPYGQSGRRGTVYQIQAETDRSYHAIKVFTRLFQDVRNEKIAARLSGFSGLPGLQACQRGVITIDRYPNLIKKYPQLELAVLMPWVEGETWCDLILGGQKLSQEQSRGLAANFSQVLAEMEKRRMAHCDLSGANILLQVNERQVALVDVEEIYSPDLEEPDKKKLPAGTAGYAHKMVRKGRWDSDTDRFAGAVLIAEMLGWCNEKVQRNACEAQYFEGEEVQTDCPRFHVLQDCLRQDWGDGIANAFTRAWRSEKLTDCPSFEEWRRLLSPTAPQGQSTYPPGPAVPTAPAAPSERPQAARPAAPVRVARPGQRKTTSNLQRRMLFLRARQFLRRVFVTQRMVRNTILAALGVIVLAVAGGWAFQAFQSSQYGTIEGSVVDASNNPIRKPVQLAFQVGSAAPVKVTTDANGRFKAIKLPVGVVTINAQLDGYKIDPDSTHATLTSDLPLSLELKMASTQARIYGQVIAGDTGKGLQAVVAITVDGSSGAGSRRVNTQADGTYEFFVTPPASGTIVISADGYKPSQSLQFNAADVSGQPMGGTQLEPALP